MQVQRFNFIVATIEFTQTSYTANESNGNILMICVRAVGRLQREAPVTVTVTPISAQPPQDFIFAGSTTTTDLVLTPGAAQLCLNFTAPLDNIVEEDETVEISLSQTRFGDVISSPLAVVVIEDSTTVSFEFETNTYETTERNSFNVCVNLTGGSTARNINVMLSADSIIGSKQRILMGRYP